MNNAKNLLLLFTRNPELGKVKSRLAASIGEQKALLIYKELLKHTQEITKNLNVDKWVFYSEKIQENDIWTSPNYTKKLQSEGNLGEKMFNAFKEGFDNGYENIIIIGSDIYELNENHIENAFDTLDKSNAVIGPAEDGGYYLLGLKKLHPELFSNKEWGKSTVYKDTHKQLQEIKPFIVLDILNDVDVISDIKSDSLLYKLI